MLRASLLVRLSLLACLCLAAGVALAEPEKVTTVSRRAGTWTVDHKDTKGTTTIATGENRLTDSLVKPKAPATATPVTASASSAAPQEQQQQTPEEQQEQEQEFQQQQQAAAAPRVPGSGHYTVISNNNVLRQSPPAASAAATPAAQRRAFIAEHDAKRAQHVGGILLEHKQKKLQEQQSKQEAAQKRKQEAESKLKREQGAKAEAAREAAAKKKAEARRKQLVELVLKKRAELKNKAAHERSVKAEVRNKAVEQRNKYEVRTKALERRRKWLARLNERRGKEQLRKRPYARATLTTVRTGFRVRRGHTLSTLLRQFRGRRRYCSNRSLNGVWGLSNSRTCGGPRRNIGYMINVSWRQARRKIIQFRIGNDWGRGGMVAVDGYVHRMTTHNSWWGGRWNNRRGIAYSRYMWFGPGSHRALFLGFEGCCDGAQALQFRVNGGPWTYFSVSSFIQKLA